MDEALKKLLENELFDENTRTALQEAFQAKILEAEKKIESKLREEFAQRFEHDKTELVEAMDKFLSSHVRKEIEEFVEDKKGLYAERAKLSEEIVSLRKEYKAKIEEHTQKLTRFVFEQLKKELVEFNGERKALAEEKVKVAKQLRETRQAYAQQAAERIAKLEKFIIRKLTEEITEFEEDKKLLAEQRTKFALESKKTLEEARKAFIARAATLTESTIKKTLQRELTQLKDDIKVARENNFGRKIFEAFGAEFMSSYLAEGTKVKALEVTMSEIKSKLAEAEKKLLEKDQLLESVLRKVKLAESNAERTKIVNELLAPLPKDKRAVMNELLSNVKTEKLKEQFNRYLPVVLKSDSKVGERKTLSEGTETRAQSKVITGDRNNVLAESVKTEDNGDVSSAQIIELKKLAGIKS